MVLLRDAEDEDSLRSTFRTVFAKYDEDCPTGNALRSRLWKQLIELGTLDMATPEARGGGGATIAQLCVVAEEAGRNLRSVGLVEHLVATQLLGESVPTGIADTVAGAATVALRPSTHRRWRSVMTALEPSMSLGIHDGDLVAMKLSPSTDFGNKVGPLRIADLPLDGVSSTRLGPASRFQPALDTWRILTAAYLVGISEAVLSRAVAYVGDRRQFERPIGSYQVVQQGLAEIPGMIAGARLLAAKAAWSCTSDDFSVAHDAARNDITDGRVLASMAFLFAAETAAQAVDRSLHYHGAIGATAEYGIHNFYQAACSLPLILGPLHIERRRLADLLLESTWTSR
jgi:alkylation response protein AidB-like acyl-CoA dehydrogenase